MHRSLDKNRSNPTSCATSVPLGRVGPYQLIASAGEGGNANVYRALAPDGNDVAVKLLEKENDRAGDLKRIDREVSTFSRFSHPHLLGLLDSGIDDDRGPYLVTPFIEGSTLWDFASQHRLCPDAVVVLLIALLEGLSELHVHRIVHRDLKPENIMVTPEGAFVILDFGLVFHEQMSRLTTEGSVVGSVPYMSPEQIEGQRVTVRSDIWSVGVIAYELCCGRRPFQRSLQGEEVAAILKARVKPLEEVDRRVSGPMSALIGRCLEADPARRPADARALLTQVLGLADWKEDLDPRVERKRLLADPDGFCEERSASRAARWKQLAEAAIDAGDSFQAIDHIDRALAHSPEDEGIGPLITRAVSAQTAEGGRPPVSSSVVHAVRRSVWPMLIGIFLCVLMGVGLLFRGETPQPESLLPPQESGTAVPVKEEIAKDASLHPRAEESESIADSEADETQVVKKFGNLTIKADRELIEGLGRLAKGVKEGLSAQAKERRRESYQEGKVESPDLSEADETAIDLAGNFAELLFEAGVASMQTSEPGTKPVISRNGQRAAVAVMGDMVRLFELGLEED